MLLDVSNVHTILLCEANAKASIWTAVHSRTHILSQIKNVLMYFVVRCQIQSDRCLDE